MKKSILIIALLLSGCISVFPDSGETSKKVFLDLCPLEPHMRAPHPHVLIVERPQAHSDLGTKKIRLIRTANCHTIADIIADYEWDDELPNLIESAIIGGIEQGCLFEGVGKASEGIKSDLTLITEIRHFDVVAVCDPHVRIELAIKVVKTTDHQLLAQKVFQYHQPIECISLNEILDAYSFTVDQFLRDLNTWLAKIK